MDPWPTSPMKRSPVSRSNEKRHGFRRPFAQASFGPPERDEGIVRGNAVVRRSVHALVDVDPQELAEQILAPRLRLHPLREALRIVRAAAIPHADVEKPVRTELELSAVVVVERLVDRQQRHAAERVGDVGVRGDRVPRDDGVPDGVRVVDVEEPVLGVVRMKGRGQQPLLAATDDERRDVQKGRGQDSRAVPDQDLAAVEREEDPAVAGVGDGRDPADRSRDRRQDDVGRHRRRLRRAAIRGDFVTGPPFVRADAGDGERRRRDGDAEQSCNREFRPHAAIITTAAGREIPVPAFRWT